VTRSKDRDQSPSERLRERIDELRVSGRVTDRAWAEGYDAALEDVIDVLSLLDRLDVNVQAQVEPSTELKAGQRRCHDCPSPAAEGRGRCDRCLAKTAARAKRAWERRKAGAP